MTSASSADVPAQGRTSPPVGEGISCNGTAREIPRPACFASAANKPVQRRAQGFARRINQENAGSVMKTTPVWRWLAAGVLALGLNGWYQDGGAPWAHVLVQQVDQRTVVVLELVKDRADRFWAEARLFRSAIVDRSNPLHPGSALNRSEKQFSRSQSSSQSCQ